MTATTLIGIFANKEHANGAIEDLQKMGMDPSSMSVMVKDTDWVTEVVKNKGVRVAETAAGGAGTGLALGAIAGLLVGLGTITIPGIGALFIGGPIASALGLTGAAAAAVSAATSGALAGGLVGALVGLGLPREVAQVYEERVKEGAVVLAVPAHSTDQQRVVEDVFQSHLAEDIHAIDETRRERDARRHMTARA